MFPEQEGEGDLDAKDGNPNRFEGIESDAEIESNADEDHYATVDSTNTGALPSQLEQHESEDEGQPLLRRGERERKLPGKFLNFFTGYGAVSGDPCITDVPNCYNDIGGRDDRTLWLKAVPEELDSIEANEVWKLQRCLRSIKPLQSKWVFRVKEDNSGKEVRYKARLVEKGYLQRQGIDYEETYAPVAKLTTIRTVLAVGVRNRFLFHQMDVKTAFLHGELKEDIYMAVPDGVRENQGLVCKLQKSLYGLKQSPRCWNERLIGQLVLKIGFTRSSHDYCLYTKCTPGDELIIVLYVDDLLIAGRKLTSIVRLKKELSAVFKMTDCGEANYFLGMKLVYNREEGTLRLSQEAQVTKILQRFDMVNCNYCKTPMEKGLQLKRDGPSTKEPYRECWVV